jgi:hypothetical protein
VPYLWEEEQQEAFDALKKALVEAPVLAHPIQGGDFVLDTVASAFGLGGVLSQVQDGVEKVIAYASQSLSASE